MLPQEKAKQNLFTYLKNNPIFHNSQIIIFGSFARNEERYDSDLDVLIISDKIDQPTILDTISSLRYCDDDTAEIDVKVISTNKWNNSNSTFIKTIKMEGADVTEEFRNLL